MPINPPMKASDLRIDHTQHDEGYSETSYPDPQGQTKTWAIGFGTNAPWVKPGMTCTMEQALAWFFAKWHPAEDCVNSAVNVPLEQYQFDALVDFVYNVGCGSRETGKGFLGSTMLKKLNSGDYLSVESEIMRWVYSGGKVNRGLIVRRDEERDEFNGPEKA